MADPEERPFIIPAGTQVVLKQEKRLPGAAGSRPPGSVAEVIESPSTNRFAYTIRFVDGAEAKAKIGELAVRRREVDGELAGGEGALATPGEDLRPHVIYRCAVGSRAFGLETESSDEDIRGVYLPPASLHWSLWKPPEQWESAGGGRDEVYWELEKFLVLALKANPGILECLWTPIVLDAGEVGRELRGMREAFLSKHIYATYSGYVLSQFRRMKNAHESRGAFKTKHAMHLVRLLLSGIDALVTGEIRVDVREHREELLEIKSGRVPFEAIHARALDLDRRFREAFAGTRLPERPDYARVNGFLVRSRRRMVDAERTPAE